jgi:predicted phosphoadenosine phosphosulfate sulfurtransferase
MNYEEWDLTELWNAVCYSKREYIKARNARKPTHELWNNYARFLHLYRLRRRELIND